MSKGLGSDLVIFDEAGNLNVDQLMADGWFQVGAMEEHESITQDDHTGFTHQAEIWTPVTVDGKQSDVVTPHPSGFTPLVAKIDKLISEQKCPRCGRDWHESVLTQRIWTMYQEGKTDPNYFAHQDRSPILCEGSRFIGPIRPKVETASASHSIMIEPLFKNSDKPFLKLGTMLQEMFTSLNTIAVKFDTWLPSWEWTGQFYTLTTTSACSDPIIEFGSQNWKYEFRRVPGQQWVVDQTLCPDFHCMASMVWENWGSFLPELELPPKPKRNWSKLDTLMPTKYPSTKGHTHEAQRVRTTRLR